MYETSSFINSFSWHNFYIVLEEFDEGITLLLICYLWFKFTPLSLKIKCISAAAFFSLIEFFFRGLTEDGPNGQVFFSPYTFTFARCNTTWYLLFFFENLCLC